MENNEQLRVDDANSKATMVESMLHMQHQLNNGTIGEGWEFKTEHNGKALDWKLAGLLELAEGLNSIAWKWWKGTETDVANVRVEVVDLWHFLFSDAITQYSMYNLQFLIGKLLVECFMKVPNLSEEFNPMFDPQVVSRSSRLLISDLAMGKEPDMNNLANLTIAAGFDVKSLYQAYIVKNVLNGFRQANGYKLPPEHKDVYIKEWIGADGKTYEDNVIAFEIADSLEISSEYPNKLLELITDSYAFTVKTTAELKKKIEE